MSWVSILVLRPDSARHKFTGSLLSICLKKSFHAVQWRGFTQCRRPYSREKRDTDGEIWRECVGSFVSSLVFVLPSVLRGNVCMRLGETRPTREAKCWHFSLRAHRWILSKSHYTGQNKDAGCENAVAYGHFISPMFFNNFTDSIPFSIDAYFNCKLTRSQCRQLACTPGDTRATCDLFLSCTNTLLIATWWAVLFHTFYCLVDMIFSTSGCFADVHCQFSTPVFHYDTCSSGQL